MSHTPEEDSLEDDLPGPGLAPWPSPPGTSDVQRDSRRQASWMHFVTQTRAEPLPKLSPWTRLLQQTSRVLEDLLSVGVSRGGMVISQRSPTLAMGMVKGTSDSKSPPEAVTGEPIDLEPVLAGDLLTLTWVLPGEGALIVLLRDGHGVSRLHPSRPGDLAVRPTGTRIRVRGQVHGHPGDVQTLLVGISPQSLPASLLSLEGDALLEALTTVPSLALQSYRLLLGAGA